MIFPWSFWISKIATHSKIDAREITKKFLRSAFENFPEPSAIFSGTLNEALPNWSITYRSMFFPRINDLHSWWNTFAFEYTVNFLNSNMNVDLIENKPYNASLSILFFILLKITSLSARSPFSFSLSVLFLALFLLLALFLSWLLLKISLPLI